MDVEATVLIVAHNQADVLPTCLAHLELQTLPAARFEILVVDAASTDDTETIVTRHASGSPTATRCLRHPNANRVAACNAGWREARGRIVLFLDEELLAGPNLVEHHLLAHEQHSDRVCVVGNIMPHPQLSPNSYVPWRVLEPDRQLQDNTTLHFLDWRGQNMSLPRQLVLDHGGFDEEFLFPYFADAELAWRLKCKGIQAIFEQRAAAYIWRPSTIQMERSRYYARGYSLHALARKTQPGEILRRYPVQRNVLSQWLGALVMGPSARACEMLSQETRLFKELYSLVLQQEFLQGYRDASKGEMPHTRLGAHRHA